MRDLPIRGGGDLQIYTGDIKTYLRAYIYAWIRVSRLRISSAVISTVDHKGANPGYTMTFSRVDGNFGYWAIPTGTKGRIDNMFYVEIKGTYESN